MRDNQPPAIRCWAQGGVYFAYLDRLAGTPPDRTLLKLFGLRTIAAWWGCCWKHAFSDSKRRTYHVEDKEKIVCLRGYLRSIYAGRPVYNILCCLYNYYGSHNIDTEKIPKYSCFIIFKFQHRSDFLSLFKSISFRPTFMWWISPSNYSDIPVILEVRVLRKPNICKKPNDPSDDNIYTYP